MVYQIIIKPGAEADIDDVYHYYNNIREGLGLEFIISFHERKKKIAQYPFSNFNVTEKVRRATVPKFPINIYYTIEQTSIIIHLVMHQYRNPSYLKQRIG